LIAQSLLIFSQLRLEFESDIENKEPQAECFNNE